MWIGRKEDLTKGPFCEVAEGNFVKLYSRVKEPKRSSAFLQLVGAEFFATKEL